MQRQRGFTLIELLIVVAIIGVLSAIAIPLLQTAIQRAHVSAAAADAKTLFTAFKQHYVDHNMYPYQTSSPAFQLDTFEPLITMGYYRGSMSSKLQGARADGYDSPDDEGVNQEFWLEMTLEVDSTIRFVVADSDNSPLGGGNYLDGVYIFQNGVLKPIEDVL